MNESELIPGDVIFFQNNYHQTPESDAYSYIDHVALFSGYNDFGHPQLIHSITSKKGHYHPEAVSGVCQTTLRQLRNQLQREKGYPDAHYDVEYKVFRFNDASIASNALRIIKKQTRYHTPYDELRLEEKLKREDQGFTGNDFKLLAEARYKPVGIYQAIKYAAREGLMLFRPRINGIGRGPTCSMLVILGYQIAELLAQNLVNPIDHLSDDKWVSNKYAPRTDSASYPVAYNAYLDTIQQDVDRVDSCSLLAYDCWNHQAGILPESYVHTSFAVDAKVIGAEGLYVYMQEKSESWTSLGTLMVMDREFTSEQRIRYKEVKKACFFERARNTQQFKEERAACVSPASSCSPWSEHIKQSNSPTPSPSPNLVFDSTPPKEINKPSIIVPTPRNLAAFFEVVAQSTADKKNDDLSPEAVVYQVEEPALI